MYQFKVVFTFRDLYLFQAHKSKHRQIKMRKYRPSILVFEDFLYRPNQKIQSVQVKIHSTFTQPHLFRGLKSPFAASWELRAANLFDLSAIMK
jgi:hypothetical protein